MRLEIHRSLDQSIAEGEGTEKKIFQHEEEDEEEKSIKIGYQFPSKVVVTHIIVNENKSPLPNGGRRERICPP
jgi:hypothetical protein